MISTTFLKINFASAKIKVGNHTRIERMSLIIRRLPFLYSTIYLIPSLKAKILLLRATFFHSFNCFICYNAQFILNTKHATLKEDLFLHPRTENNRNNKRNYSKLFTYIKSRKNKGRSIWFWSNEGGYNSILFLWKLLYKCTIVYYIEFLKILFQQSFLYENWKKG